MPDMQCPRNGRYLTCIETGRDLYYDYPHQDGAVWQCLTCHTYYKVVHSRDKYGHSHISCWTPATAQEYACYLGMQELAPYTVEAIQRRLLAQG